MTDPKIRSIYFVSLGCSKNLVDSQIMLGAVASAGFEIVETPQQAETIVVNTCGFIGDAKKESIDTILEMSDYKDPALGSCTTLVMAGCMAQRYIDQLQEEMPEVDIFIGTGEYQRLAEILNKQTGKQANRQAQKTYVGTPEFIHSEMDARLNTSPSYMAWLKVAEGCERNCTFCAIPSIRGKFRSRTVESLVQESINLVNSGVKELNMIAQDFSKYGSDLDRDDNVPNLLNALSQIDGAQWLRIFYFYPDDITQEFVDAILASPKICRYLDIPIQHFSDNVLKRMNRQITGKEIIEKIHLLREKIPNISIRTSVIVGFPGETEEDFQDLVNGIEQLQFDHLGVFKYSDEDETPAAKLPNKIDQEIIDDRYRQIYQIQEEIAEERNQSYLGKTLDVIIEGHHDDTELLLQGRHMGQAPEIDGKVIINDGVAQIGDIVQVKISEILGHDLLGQIVHKE